MKTDNNLTGMPPVNKRLLYVISVKYGTNINRFSQFAGITQQRLNRLFNPDTRNGKYPSVPCDILAAICDLYEDVNMRWVLTGKGEAFVTENIKDYLIEVQKLTIDSLKNLK